MRVLFKPVLLCVMTLAVAVSPAAAAAEDADLAKAAQKSNNPVSDAWLLITQNDLTFIDGDATSGTEVRERLSFQPVLPVPIFDGEWNLVTRPVFQFYDAPLDGDLGAADPFGDRTAGMGDTVLFSLLAPNRDDGFIWGVGPTFIFPTATDDVLGQEKWQAGPAALLVNLGTEHGGWGWNHFNIGVLAQHWWDFDGDDDRPDTSQTDIQYFINWRKNETQLIGMTPNIQIDWEKDGSDRFSIPIGLGTIGFIKVGNTPVRWGLEFQYYVMQPDPAGPLINLKAFIAPVKANPFK
ncbi:MAG: hypothetical protein JSW27_05055 [Phycisphaerales bacterium]|nr:MAG: hypothetical protein JSW27_05055 [Phycisphaerales bacterium]